MSRVFIFFTLFIYASSQRIISSQIPCPGPLRPLPLTPCGNPQPIRNPAIGCLDPIITPCGTITEVPFNLGNLILPATPCASQTMPATTCANQILPPCANQILPASTLTSILPATPCGYSNLPAATLPLANPFLPVASPVSPYMPISPYLPPASPCNNKCQYLKKIPIPPPCI